MDNTTARAALLEEIAGRIASQPNRRHIVAVDGVDGAGKTVFADQLGSAVAALGRQVVQASIDGFHNPRAVRYRRGRNDPEGFFLDSYDYGALREDLLEPFRSGASHVRIARFDHRTDSEVAGADIEVGAAAILVVDGIFLHRDELTGWWDTSIFLNVPFAVSYARMAERDGSDPDPHAVGNRRYLEGQQIYLGQCNPLARATIVVDNSDLDAPKLVTKG